MLHSSSLIVGLLLSSSVWAGSFDFLPAASGPEKEFQSLMNAGNYRQALITWSTAHAHSPFATSTNGTATYAFLLNQNGLPFSAQELLVQNTQPSRLNPSLLKIWTAELQKSPFMQKGWIASSGGWKNIVHNDPVSIRINNKSDISIAFGQARRLPNDQLNAKARVLWQIATRAPLINENESALSALKELKESKQNLIGQDLISINQARVLFQKGDLEGALKAYQEVPKSSNLWVESVEERAWTQVRREEFDKALGTVVTLLSPALAPLEGPEPFYLANYLNLRVCDYVQLFKVSDLFKKRHRTRLSDIQEMARTGTNKNINSALEKFEKGGVSLDAVGSLIESLPRTTLRDTKFVRTMQTRHQLLNEEKTANQLVQETSALGGQSLIENIAITARLKADRARQNAVQRLRALAQSEVKDYEVVLNKMHIVEAQAIERLHLDDSLKGQRSKLAKTDDNGDVLVFPYKSDEVWFDELDNYQARVKDCPTLKGASL